MDDNVAMAGSIAADLGTVIETPINGVNGIAAGNGALDHPQDAASGTNAQPGKTADNPVLTPVEVSAANSDLVEHMRRVLENSLNSALELQMKLKRTYWIVTILSIVMFLVGMALISTPLWAPIANAQFEGDGPYNWQTILTTVGIGVADLIALFLFGPINRIQRLMADFSQLIISLETYQVQVALRLLEADSNVRESLGKASEYIGRLTKEILKLIESYYEAELEQESNSTKATPPQTNQVSGGQ